ncbi:protein polyglycylase TTLL10 [Pygocentrus nattereri]|uniref:Tubulin tyrosine ligase-like family, member 10 n=1 Tax=Pygocentrus nattereri TaxID=42514 RepID=A0A3B4E942_PYGNA|nr:protein polyglycylase TTLL10 [Pygocentrus nattereri]
MSSASWGEPAQRSEECVTERPQGEECVYGDAIVTEELEEAEKEFGKDEVQGGKEGTLEHVGEDKQQKRMKSHGRRQDTQGMNEKQVTQADGAAPASICLVEHYLSASRRSTLKQQRRAAQVHYPQADKDGDKHPDEPRGPGPFFFFGGGNGASIVIPYCESKGWQRIYDKTREDYKLKWCELKAPCTYNSFRAGEQLVYQIPNNKVLTTKIGLLNSLREYDRVCSKVKQGQGLRKLKMEEFIPDTFRMDVKDEREAFFAQQEGLHAGKGNMWICKPTGLNQGRGIFLLRNLEDIIGFRAKIENKADGLANRKFPFRMPQAQITQRYIQNPLLLKGKKFDVRSYFLIACTTPYMVFFRHGYVRLTCDLYDPNSFNLSAHLTNQYMQKKNPLYSMLKEETVWSMERFNAYINENFMEPKDLPKDWVLSVFAKRMQQIMIQCFLAVKSKLECKLGYFDLIGCDFLIDEDFKVWLLEMNCNPALHTNCEVLKEVVPRTVTETLDLALEIFNKCRGGLKLFPLSSQKDFVLLYCGESTSIPFTKQRSRTVGSLRMAHPKRGSTPKKTNRATVAPNGDNSATRTTGSICSSETLANHSVPSVLANSSCSSSTASSSLSFVEPVKPKQNSTSETFASTTDITTSETPANHNVPFSACPSYSSSSSSGPTPAVFKAIFCDQQLAESQSKQVSGKTTTTQKSRRAKPAEKSRSRPRTRKATQNRLELRLNKCTWQQSGMTTVFRMPPETARAKSTITSLSSPALSEALDLTRGLRSQGNQYGRSFCLKPTESDLAQSLSCQPLRSEKLESFTSTEKSSPVKS